MSSDRTQIGGGPVGYLTRSAHQTARVACRWQVVVVVADRLVTVSITCWVHGVAHEVTEEEVATSSRFDDRRYRAICGYRFVWRPAVLVTLTGQPCPQCAAVLAAAREPQPTADQVRRPGHRRPG
ncbi:MAG: hypothetical protein ACRDQ4_09360 [Pseudonocardiaceae bacterium]